MYVLRFCQQRNREITRKKPLTYLNADELCEAKRRLVGRDSIQYTRRRLPSNRTQAADNELKNGFALYIAYTARPAAECSKSTKCARFLNSQSPLMCNFCSGNGWSLRIIAIQCVINWPLKLRAAGVMAVNIRSFNGPLFTAAAVGLFLFTNAFNELVNRR